MVDLGMKNSETVREVLHVGPLSLWERVRVRAA
jgi:hypothetical protein